MISFDVSPFTMDPEGSLSYWNISFERKLLDSFWHIFNFFVLSVQRKTVQSEGWHCCGITVYISFRKFGSLNCEFWTGSEHRTPRVTYVDIQLFLLLLGVVKLRVFLHLNNMHMNWVQYRNENKQLATFPAHPGDKNTKWLTRNITLYKFHSVIHFNHQTTFWILPCVESLTHSGIQDSIVLFAKLVHKEPFLAGTIS